MTLVEELTHLAVTGSLGTLRPEARMTDIAAEHGAPEDLGPVRRKHRWPRRFGLGSVELLFCRCRTLRSLTLSAMAEPVTLPGPGRGQLRRFEPRVTESELVAAMSGSGCSWEIREFNFGQRDLALMPAENVRVRFALVDRVAYDGPQSEERFLAKAGFWTLGHEVCSEAAS